MSKDPVAFAVFNEIGIIDQLARSMFDSVLPPGLSIAQFTVLNHFVRRGASSPARLAAAFQVTRPTMTNTLARLHRAGLVRIEADPADGRGKIVDITPAGAAMRHDCIRRLAVLRPHIAGAVPDAALERLLPLLREMRIALDALRD